MDTTYHKKSSQTGNANKNHKMLLYNHRMSTRKMITKPNVGKMWEQLEFPYIAYGNVNLWKKLWQFLIKLNEYLSTLW